jgi:hypothetical protein
MKNSGLTSVPCVFGLAVLLVTATSVRSQQPGAPANDPPRPPQEGVEVQARGPIHEAFAEPVIRGPRDSPAVPKQPPEPIEELPPDQKPPGDNVEWIPGYWAWDVDTSDFLWVSGTWRAVPPGRQWVPGHWSQGADGWQWGAGYWSNNDQQDLDLLPQPPDPIVENPPPPTVADDVFVPGTWVYRDSRYLWRPGFYVTPQAGWMWNPAGYIWTPAGYIFVDGFWDYPLQTRGMLFAPVTVDRQVLLQPNWVYRPSYVVQDAFLLGSMFVRPATASFYFGDYFDRRYADLGFRSWADYRIGRFPDPLWSYYRWKFRDNPRWDRDLRQVYTGRRDGDLPRPPRTFAQQNKSVVRNTTVNNAININNIRNMRAVNSLSDVKRSGVKVEQMNGARFTQERQAAQHYRDVSRDRGKVESGVISKGSPLKGGREDTSVRVQPPKLRPPAKHPEANKPPPHPNVPKPGPRPGQGGKSKEPKKKG